MPRSGSIPRWLAIPLAGLALGCAPSGAAEDATIFQAIDASLASPAGAALDGLPIARWTEVDQRDALGRTPLTYLIAQAGDQAGPADPAATQRLATATRIAEALLAHGAQPGLADADGSPPLHLALAAGDVQLAHLLLAHHAEVEAVDRHGRTPLMVAVDALWPQAGLVGELLRAGAHPDAPAAVAMRRDGDAPPPAPLAAAVLARLKAVDDLRQDAQPVFGGPDPSTRAEAALAIVAALLDAHAHSELLIPGPSGFPWPLLHAAIRAGDLPTARLLVAHGAALGGTVDNGLGLMGCAVDSGRADLVPFLAGLGVAVDERDARGEPLVCRVDEPGMLAALLAAGADPDARRGDRRTLLHLAAEADNAALIAALIDHHAAIDARLDPARPGETAAKPGEDGWIVGRTPLWLALEQHRPHALLALLRRGAAVKLRLADGTTILHLAATWSGPLEEEATAGGTGAETAGLPTDASALIRLLVAEGADPNALTTRPAGARATAAWRRSPLHAACLAHALDAATVLLTLGADPRQMDSVGAEPWRLALDDAARRPAWLELFRNAGVAITARELRPLELRQAIGDGDRQRVAALIADDPALATASLPAPGPEATTAMPLHLAITARQDGIAMLLLDHGADAGARDGRGRLPLHLAVAGGREAVVEELAKRGADLDASTQSGNGEAVTPLMIALGRFPGGAPLRDPAAQLAMATLLLGHGASAVHGDGHDHCPLEIAVAAGNLDAVELLLAHGAQADFVDSGGHTLLHLLGWGAPRSLEIAALLLAKGIDPNRADTTKAAETVLHRVARTARGPVIPWLLAHGARADVGDARRWTPLHIAADSANLSAVTALIAGGAPLGAADAAGTTPLAVAIEAGQGDIVALLLDHHAPGADTDVATVRGWSHLRQGQHYQLQALLDRNPAIARGRLIRGQTLLMRAADRQDALSARLLLDHGAEVEALDDQGRSALLHAADADRGDDPAVAAMLLAAGAAVDRADRGGATALGLATAKRNAADRKRAAAAERLIALLISAGAGGGKPTAPR